MFIFRICTCVIHGTDKGLYIIVANLFIIFIYLYTSEGDFTCFSINCNILSFSGNLDIALTILWQDQVKLCFLHFLWLCHNLVVLLPSNKYFNVTVTAYNAYGNTTITLFMSKSLITQLTFTVNNGIYVYLYYRRICTV